MFRGGKQAFCVIDTQGGNVVVEGDAHFFMEQLAEMRGVITCVVGNVLQGDLFLKVQVDIFKRFLNFTLLRGIVHRFLVVEGEE